MSILLLQDCMICRQFVRFPTPAVHTHTSRTFDSVFSRACRSFFRNDIRAKLDDGTQSFLRDASRSFCEVALPEDQGELEAACEAAAVDRGEASGSGGTRGAGGDSSRSVMETASRLAQVKSGVLEPMLCQVLTQQVVG